MFFKSSKTHLFCFYEILLEDLWVFLVIYDFKKCLEKGGTSGIWTHDDWILFRSSERPSYQSLSSTRTLEQTFYCLSILIICSVFRFHLVISFHFISFLRLSPHLRQSKYPAGNHMSVAEVICRKLAWVEFEYIYVYICIYMHIYVIHIIYIMYVYILNIYYMYLI